VQGKIAQAKLNCLTGQFRGLTIIGKQSQLPGTIMLIVKDIYSFTPADLLAVVDLAKVKDLPLTDFTAWQPAIFDYGPVAMFFTILETFFCS
jgi:hypothetical protein